VSERGRAPRTASVHIGKRISTATTKERRQRPDERPPFWSRNFHTIRKYQRRGEKGRDLQQHEHLGLRQPCLHPGPDASWSPTRRDSFFGYIGDLLFICGRKTVKS
jgi:hypothetical protein